MSADLIPCSSALDLWLKMSYYLRLVALWKNFMHRRERWYHQRDNNRLVRPFEWGLSYIFDHVNGDDPRVVLRNHTARAMSASEEFYTLPPITDYVLDGDQLTWT